MGSFFASKIFLIIGLELLIGVVVGIGCSLLSIRKHIKV
jgi:hypothetical protein